MGQESPGMERNFNLGDVHMMLCTDYVLLSYSLETCIVLQCHPNKFSK